MKKAIIIGTLALTLSIILNVLQYEENTKIHKENKECHENFDSMTVQAKRGLKMTEQMIAKYDTLKAKK